MTKSYNVTLAIDHGELPSGNGRKTSVESADMIIEETVGHRSNYGTNLISSPSFEWGDTVWVVSAHIDLTDKEVLELEKEYHVEDIEEVSIEKSKGEK